MADEQKPETYTTLGGTADAEYEEKRSLFIGHASPARTEDEANDFIRRMKKQYADATHNVSAYYIKDGIYARYSDDGEPQGTSGMPVLDVIRKSGVNDAVIVVTRYFGGTLLGAGGLVRAYSHTAKLAMEAAGIVTYQKYTTLTLTCSYSDYGRYQAELPKFGAVLDGTDFSDRVTLSFAVRGTVFPALRDRIREMSGGRDEPDVTGERYDYR